MISLRATIAYTVAVMIGLSWLGSSVVFAQPAYTINYQGKLTDSTGLSVADGLYVMEFNLYTAPTGGTAIWTESRTGGNEEIGRAHV